MADWLNSLTDFAGGAKSMIDTAINASSTLVSVAGTVGIAGFVFDIADDETIELDADITDHYVENGTAVQDHIALRPERVTVRGLVGEYKHIVEGKQTTLQKATKKLTTLASYLPPLSDAASAIYKGLQGKNENASLSFLSGSLNNVTNTAMDLFKAYRNVNIPQTEQQKAFIFFEALRNNRSLFTIQTPFRYYTDMAVESIRASQSGFSRDQSDFEVTFKKMRFVNVERNEIENSNQNQKDADVYSSRLAKQKATITDDGLISVKEITNDTFESIIDRYTPKSISDRIEGAI